MQQHHYNLKIYEIFIVCKCHVNCALNLKNAEKCIENTLFELAASVSTMIFLQEFRDFSGLYATGLRNLTDVKILSKVTDNSKY